MRTRSSSRRSAAAAPAAKAIAENARAVERKRPATAGAGAAAKRRKPLGNISNANKNSVRARLSTDRPPSAARAPALWLTLRLPAQRGGSAGSRRKARAASASASSQVQQLVPNIRLDPDEPLPHGVRDIDAGEEDDPTLVSCYARPVYKHLLEVEVCLPFSTACPGRPTLEISAEGEH